MGNLRDEHYCLFDNASSIERKDNFVCYQFKQLRHRYKLSSLVGHYIWEVNGTITKHVGGRLPRQMYGT